MLNSCDFQGRFAADPELRTTQTGKQVASFRMAVDRDMVDATALRTGSPLPHGARRRSSSASTSARGAPLWFIPAARRGSMRIRTATTARRLSSWWTTSILPGRSRTTSRGPWMMAGRTRHRQPIGTSSRSPSRWASPPRASASSGRGRTIIPAMFRSARAFLRAVTMISRFWTMPMICRSNRGKGVVGW